MLEQEFKSKWLVALRSGEYKQIRERLKTDNGHCCLGVGLEIKGLASADNLINEWSFNSIQSSVDLQNALGISGEEQTKLVELNDSGKPFSEIADYIESNL